jgi:hypothetical protein
VKEKGEYIYEIELHCERNSDIVRNKICLQNTTSIKDIVTSEPICFSGKYIPFIAPTLKFIWLAVYQFCTDLFSFCKRMQISIVITRRNNYLISKKKKETAMFDFAT